MPITSTGFRPSARAPPHRASTRRCLAGAARLHGLTFIASNRIPALSGQDDAGVETAVRVRRPPSQPGSMPSPRGRTTLPAGLRGVVPGTMLPRRCAFEPDCRATHRRKYRPDPLTPIRICHVRKEVHVNMTIPRVSEHHDIDLLAAPQAASIASRYSARRGGGTQPSSITCNERLPSESAARTGLAP